MLLKEAGCQGSYIPYGKEAIVRFFMASIPELFDIIKNKPKKNIVLTFVGDLEIAKRHNLQISDFGKNSISNQIIKNFL